MKHLIYLLSFAIAVPFLFACDNKPTDTLTPTTSLLWEITKDGLEHKTYIYGTMHLIEKEFFYFPESLEKLVQESSVLVMEMDGLPDYASAMSLMLLPEGQTIHEFFEESQMELIYDFMEKEMKMNKEAFDFTFGKMKPFIILQLITSKQFEGETESFEMTLNKIAKDNKLEIKGLETIEQQLGFFDQIPAKELGSMIVSYFEDSESLITQTKEMQRVYRKGDLDSLALFMNESAPELMAFEDILLTNRNKAWIPKIIEFIHNKPTFIAVGAAHLAGENGVLELLKKEGYSVRPLTY